MMTSAVGSPSPADLSGRWIRPAGPVPREPRWGHPAGMQLGISSAPRGLLQIFTPYLEHPPERLVNYIAVEPVPAGSSERGYSELEPSTLDPGERGKRMWAVDDPSDAAVRARLDPDSGIVDTADGVERLTIWIRVEPFDNGAQVQVRVRFRADRPHEVELAGYSGSDSVPLDRLILSATMGNWARLRRLELAHRVVTPAGLWPGFTGTGFTAHASFGLDELAREGGAALVSATGDEDDPWSVGYSADTADHWRFLGRRMRQTWRVDDPHPALRAQVNARWSYWASASEIPGGPAYENLEVVQPFRQGAALRFIVEPLD